jgi:hypothetical protein
MCIKNTIVDYDVVDIQRLYLQVLARVHIPELRPGLWEVAMSQLPDDVRISAFRVLCSWGIDVTPCVHQFILERPALREEAILYLSRASDEIVDGCVPMLRRLLLQGSYPDNIRKIRPRHLSKLRDAIKTRILADSLGTSPTWWSASAIFDLLPHLVSADFYHVLQDLGAKNIFSYMSTGTLCLCIRNFYEMYRGDRNMTETIVRAVMVCSRPHDFKQVDARVEILQTLMEFDADGVGNCMKTILEEYTRAPRNESLEILCRSMLDVMHQSRYTEELMAEICYAF